MNKEKTYHRGIWLGLGAYGAWGVLPLYWKSLGTVPALEILANRVFWSLVFMLLLLMSQKKLGSAYQETRAIFRNRRQALTLLGGSLTITVNWGLYIWAVNAGHIIETSMGYYINPLVSVLLGVFCLGEKLDRWTQASVLLAAAGVGLLLVQVGVFPWISVGLALSFGLYGLIKKTLVVTTTTGILLETLMITPIALIYLYTSADYALWGGQQGGLVTSLLLMGAGVVTALPLLLFTAGAKLLPLSVLGFLQYVSPTLTLLLGIFVYKETFTHQHLLSFGCIWAALAVFSVGQLRKSTLAS
ncbi:MAG: EamA family transporter RarD [Acidaminococcaceae bacterium]